MKKKEKILIVHNYYQIPGGEDTVVANEKKLLEKNGHDVVLYVRRNSELNSMGVVSKLLLPFTTVFNIRTYKDIRKIIKDKKIDVIHVHNTLNLISPSVYYAALSRKIPVLQVVHNFRLLCPAGTFYREGHICEECLKKGFKKSILHRCYRNSLLQTMACVINNKIHSILGIYKKINYICLTEFNKKKLLNNKQINNNKIYIKPNFAYDCIESNENKYELIEYRQRNNFIYVGRLEEIKGTKILFSAWKKIDNIINSKLVVCGIGPLENWCKNYIIENNIGNIEMKGYVNHEDVLALMGNAKALILPTQVYEGFPMTIAEAFSVGTPCIGSNIGNTACLIENEYNGLLFQSDSEYDLAKKIVELNNEKEIDYLKNSRETFEQKYTSEINYQEYLKIYKSLERI